MEHFDSAIDLYRQMAANIPNCSIYIFDENFDFLLAEGEEISKNGYEPEDFIGSNFFEIWPQEVTSSLASYYKAALDGHRQTLEQRVGDGFFVQHFIPVKDKNDEVIAGMVVSQNISELKEFKDRLSQKEDQLLESQNLFKTVLHSLGEGILVINKFSELLFINPAARSILDIENPQASLTDIEKQLLITPSRGGEELRRRELPLSIALEGGNIDGFVSHIENRRTGKRIYTENSARPIHNISGEVEGALIVFRDISGRKESDNEVKENLSSLREQNHRFRDLLRVVAHNMRNPSSNLSILLELHDRARGPLDKELFLDKIRELSTSFQQATQTLSTAIRAYRHTAQEWQSISLQEEIQSYRDDNEIRLRKLNVKLRVDTSRKDHFVYVPTYFESIFYSIMQEAIDANAGKDEVAIEVTSREEGKRMCLRIEVDQPLSVYEERIKEFADSENEPSRLGLFFARKQAETFGGEIKAAPPHAIEIVF